MKAHGPARSRTLYRLLGCTVAGAVLSMLSAVVGSAIYFNSESSWTIWKSYGLAADPPPPSPLRWFWQPPPMELVAGTVGSSSAFGFTEQTMVVQQAESGVGFPPWYGQVRLVAGWPLGTTEYRTEQLDASFLSIMRAQMAGRDRWFRWTQDPFSTVAELPFDHFGTLKPVAVPLRPRFPGALLNLGFWAGVCFIAVKLRGWIRLVRLKPGACQACGYMVQDLPRCPECGTPKPAVAT